MELQNCVSLTVYTAYLLCLDVIMSPGRILGKGVASGRGFWMQHSKLYSRIL